MVFYILLIMIVAIVLGVAKHGAWLYVAAACFGLLILMAVFWVWAMASGRSGFFGRGRW